MAEEIIFIGTFKTQKIKCGSVMPRTEAIEKIAKAMCKKDFGDCGKCMCRNEEECYTVVEDSKWFGLAEAALNALLDK